MKTKDMTKGSPFRLILQFALPLMAGNIFQQLYTVVDTMVVGQVLGVSALAALGAVDWTNWMMLGIIQGFTQGFSIQIAQDFGAGDLKKIRKDAAMLAILSVILALALLAAGQTGVTGILRIQQTPQEVMADAIVYLRIMFAGIPVVMAYNLFAAVLRALGDSKSPLWAILIACAVNIALDILFVGYWGCGIAGAAAATLIAQLCSALYCFYTMSRIDLLRMEKGDWQMDASFCKRLLWLGTPMAFMNAIIAVGGMIVQSVVNGFGVLFIAGFTATNKLYGLLEMAATSYGYAMVTYAGQNLGARKKDRIRKGVRSALLVAVFTSGMISVCMLVFGKEILGLFISGTPAETQEALDIAYKYLTVMSSLLLILYVLHIIRSTIQGLGDTVLPMVSGIAEFVVRTGAAFILPGAFGKEGIFFAESSAWLGADIILVISYFVRMHQIQASEEACSSNQDTAI